MSGEHYSVYEGLIKGFRERLRDSERELETERLRLAACTAAALGNIPETVAQRLPREHPYWSATYGDVCNAVDREIALRADLAAARAEIVRLTK